MSLIGAAVAFVAGIVAAMAAGVSGADGITVAALVLLITAAVLFAAFLKLRGYAPVAAIAVALLLAGILRVAAADLDAPPDWQDIPQDGDHVTVTGWLAADPSPASSAVRLHLQVVTVQSEGGEREADFPLTVFSRSLTDLIGSDRTSDGFRYGDLYRATGEFERSAPEFAGDSAGSIWSDSVSLTGAGYGNPAQRAVAGVREQLADGADRAMPEPASSLTAAMLVADRTGLTEALNEDFRDSGTAHILSISGMHIALMGGAALVASAALFGRRRQLYLIAPFAVVWGYAALAGFSPPVTRSVLMFSVYLLARLLGRQKSAVPAIGFSAALMVAVSPEVIRSVSFQLSFAAIAGIAVLYPLAMDWLRKGFPALTVNEIGQPKWQGAVFGALAVSLAATLATWPLIAINFGSTPVWGAVATPLMVPALPLFVVLGGAASAVSLISDVAGQVAGWPVWLLGEYISGIASLFASLPPGPVETSGWGGGMATVYYLCLLAAFEWRRLLQFARGSRAAVRKLRAVRTVGIATARRPSRRVPTWALVTVVAVAAVAWTGALTSAGSSELTVTFFETDRGDMILIRTPNGNTALIDGGRNPLGAVRALDETLPFWDRSLDVLLLTHPDADHVGGMQAVLERYSVGTIIEAPVEHDSTVYESWQRVVEGHGGSVTLPPGSMIALDDGVTLEVLTAGPPFADAPVNDASIVTMLRYGEVSVLLTGDITALSERRLLASGRDIRATLLKVPHHGSSTSSTAEFLAAVHPTLAVAQVGDDNLFGHPNPDVVERLLTVVPEENLFITAEDGDVIFRTDGQRAWVETER